MKKVHNLLHLWMLMVFFLPGLIINAQDLIISGIGDGPLTNGTPKVLELYVVNDISDLSAYTIKNQTNANTTWGSDYTLSGSATAGDFIYLTSTGYTANFNSFFENTLTPLENGVINLNGNDRIAIFDALDNIVDIFGEDGVDGTGTAWEYLDGWAYRNNFTSPSSTFDVADWSFSGINGLEGGTTNATCTSPMPIGTFTLGGGCPASIPFFDGFEADQTDATPLAGCWTQESVTTADTWMANSSLSDYNRTPRTGSFNAYLKYNNQDWMFYALDLTGGISYTVKLYAIQDATSGADLTVAYGVSGDAASMTNTIVPATAITNGSYQEIIGTFTPATTGTYYIGILGELTYSPWYLSIDDFEVYESPTATLSWYNLQHPATATILTDETFEVFAQAWEDGLTNADAGAPGAGIECWIGYSDTDSDPSSWTNWVPAVYNVDDGNNDEFKAELGTFAAGTYYYASRWRLDGGPYTYGGFNGGAWDGTTNVSGVLTVNEPVITYINLPISEDFEAGLGNVILVNGAETNYWMNGPLASQTGDALYITNDGSANAYSVGSTSVSHAYIPVDFNGITNATLSFDWISDGENNYDFLKVYLVPESTVITAGTQLSAADQIGTIYQDGTAIQTPVITLSATEITQDQMKLVFSWRNDGSGGTMPPASVDNILLEEITCMEPTTIAAGNITATSADITWTASILGETSWNIKVNATNTIDPTTTDGDIVANDVVNTTPLYALSSLTAETDYYVYVQSACGSDWVEYMFTTPASCPVPTGLSSLVTGASTATLTWDELGEAAWNIKINEGASINPETDPATIEATPTVTGEYLATALNGNTTYYWYVQSDCGSAWSAEGMFTTDCGIYTPDYTEDFTTYVPDCWLEADGPVTGPTTFGTSDWVADGFANAGSTGAARINLYYNNDREWLISPEFDLSLGGYELNFDVAVTTYSGTSAISMGSDDEVQLLYTLDGTTWNNLETWNAANNPSNTGDNTTVDISTLTGTNVQFAFWASDGTIDDSEDYNFFLDNFIVRTPPSCPTPTALNESSISSTNATLGWTENGTATSWNIVASTSTFDPTMSTGEFGLIPVSTNPFIIPDGTLTPNTTYYWYIQADCGGDLSAWSAEGEFTTLCDAVEFFEEDFDGVSTPNLPDCWSSYVSPSYSFQTVTTITGTPNSTPNYVSLYSSGATLATDAPILVSPIISNLNSGTKILSLSAKGNSSNTSIVIGTMSDPNDSNTFTEIETITGLSTSAWNDYNVSFETYVGTDQHIALRHPLSTTYAYVYVDDIILREASDENDILTFSLAEQTATPVVIDDMNHTVSIEVAMGTDLTALSPTITISDYATINPLSGVAQDFTGSDVTPFEYTVTSELGTDQIWQVSVIEATTQSSEKDILTFELAEETGPATIGANTVDIEVNFMADVTNLTPTVTVSPLATVSPESGIVQDFTSPVTYTVTAEDATTKDYTVTVTKEGTPLGAGCDNPIPYTNINDPEVVTAISNISRELWFTVTLDQTYVNVEFSTCASVYDTKLYVYDACGGTQLAYDDDAPTDYCSVDNNQSLIEMESLDAGTYYVLITTYSATTDISDPTTGLLVTGSNCGTPVDLIESNLTMTTADLSWTPLTAETGWNIKINEATSIDPTTVDGDIVANDAVTPNPEYSVSGLTAETDYYVYVQADCGSDWIEYMFTTPAACPVPTGLMATVLGANDVDLAWNELGTTDWVLEVSTTPLADPSTESGDILDDESVLGATGEYSLTGLDANTTYYWYVQSACGSAWSAQGVFTTDCDLVTEFTQGFDLVTTPALPDCWFKVGTTGTANTQANNNQSAPNCLYMYSSGATSVATVAMQPVSNAGDDTHQLRFSARANFTTGAIIEVGYLTDPSDASSFVLLSSETLTLTYQEFTVIPGTAPGINTYFAFRAQHVPAYSLLIDDVNWEPIPTCPKPIDLFADNITSSSADLNWTEAGGAGTWNIKVNKATAIDPTTEDGNIIANESTMDNPYTSLAGLDPATTYYFYVQADCGGGDLSAWSTAGMFTTECAAITTFPYSEPFDTYLPTVCWSEGKNGDLTTGPVTVSPTASNWIADGFGNVGTTGAAKINIYSTADSDWLISPEFELPVSPELSVLYDVAATQWNTTTAPTTPWEADDYVEFAIYAGGTWTALATYNSSNVPSNTGQTELLDIAAYAGQIVQFAFRAVEGASDGGADIDFFVDNLEIRQLPQIADIDINSDAVDVEVCEGTIEADAIAALATQITITDTDAGEHVVDLTWTIDSYDANTAADYNATGTFELPTGVLQTDPVTPLEVTALVTVTAPVEPTFSFTTEYCLNSTADALPTISDNGIEGAWAPSTIATDVAGSADYIFTPLTGECATGTTISVTINDLPVVTCPETVNVAVDEPVTFTGQDPVGGTFSGTGVVGDTFDPNGLANDTYVITYTYTDPVTGCENSCDFNVIVDIDINVADVTVEGIGIYPNPNNGEFVINFNNIEGNVTYQLYDTKGSIIILKDLSANGNTVEEISVDLVPGVYYVKVVTAKQTYVEKLVVE